MSATLPEDPIATLAPVPVTDWEKLPVRLTIRHMANIWDVSVNRAYKMHERGAFVFAECKPRTGRLAWGRDRVRAYIEGRLKGLTGVRHGGDEWR
jgi:hypothetical protein